jgi:predicted  nucleic acid-binding Zn-ribbon protein
LPAGLPLNVKTLVIQQWLQGRPRNDIAAENGVSSGAVTNIVNEWRYNLGFAVADELRELAVTMRKVGITAAQCALGFRIATVMLRIGVKEDALESFVLDVYNRCKDSGILPENICSYLTDLLEFSKTVPFSKIPHYIKEKNDEKIKLVEEIEKLKAQIGTLREQKEVAESVRNTVMEDGKITSIRLKWYSDLRAELGKYGIPVDDISKLAKLVNSVKQYQYDVENVINEFLDSEIRRLNYKYLEENVSRLENRKKYLELECITLETKISMHNQVLSKYFFLETLGFGLNQLQYLWTTVNEIARENNIPPKEAVTKFLSDVERQYNNKLGFESKLESLRNEVNKLNQELATLRMGLLSLPLVGPKLVTLAQNGITERDIINIASIFEKYIAGKDRESFVSELQNYRCLKSATQELSKQYEKMKMEVNLLETQNRDSNKDNQRINSSLANSRHDFDFVQGLINSLRSEIPGLVSISADITRSIGLQFEYLEKLKSNIRA